MIVVDGLAHEYGGKRVLSIGHWRAEQGETWLVLGPSGSGKTTLLHVLAGILRPSGGSVQVGDQDLAALGAADRDTFRGRNIGIVLQKLHLIASLSLLDNVLIARCMAGLPQDREHALELLDRVGLRDQAGRYPRQLSHGQAQRAAVARAVVNRPKVLLADEPTSNLDDANSQQAADLLASVARECGATLLIATHDQRLRDRFPQQLKLEGAA